MSDTIHTKITIEFRCDNVIDESGLQECYNGDLKKCVEDMIVDNGICGVIDNNVTVTKVERAL